MEITLTTPALLFPAISLLMVAYTNRFNTISARIRALTSLYKQNPEENLADQIVSLERRVHLIRNMQACAVASLFLCVLCLFVLFAGQGGAGKIIFGISLILMLISLAISFEEILLSVKALNLELGSMKKDSSP
uniref:DUF2721 domain-containing protein n=1 Tax=Candidatus Kentrum sp. FW TaxID=2126338 RepID=A0A450S814_9GAMM|nr:MAG: Protein of unknown function (DUF2721) [Candidatus Kentron sp. FW]VFJ47993.1 MAG: Protein of unknown function (DUF2721) [Candidatus Kentron sp. FW]